MLRSTKLLGRIADPLFGTLMGHEMHQNEEDQHGNDGLTAKTSGGPDTLSSLNMQRVKNPESKGRDRGKRPGIGRRQSTYV